MASAKDLGVNALVAKPFTQAQLLDAVALALASEK